MKKAYKLYLIVFTVLSIIGLVVLNRVVAYYNAQLKALTEDSVYAAQPLPAQTSVPVVTPPSAPPSPLKPETSVKPAKPEFIACGTGQSVPIVGPYGSKVTPCGGASFGRDPGLVAVNGWSDQPNRDKPGRIHENLRIRLVSASGRYPARAP